MYAQEFLLLEIVNNITVIENGKLRRRLEAEERSRLVDALRRQKTASPATIRSVLGLIRGPKKQTCSLSLDADSSRTLNTDWFYREIVIGAIGEDNWHTMSDRMHDSINRALLKFDPDSSLHRARFEKGCSKWWSLDGQQSEALLHAWGKRPRLDQRVCLSRRAIRNLLPYMRRDGFNVTEARKHFAEDPSSGASREQRSRYSIGALKLSRRVRRFRKRHPNKLPPPPMMSNPVVRKAIYEVRRHIQAYIIRFGRPDQIIIELARDASVVRHNYIDI
jgi:hypothetical protein